jgi:hypothetical protein
MLQFIAVEMIEIDRTSRIERVESSVEIFDLFPSEVRVKKVPHSYSMEMRLTSAILSRQQNETNNRPETDSVTRSKEEEKECCCSGRMTHRLDECLCSRSM